MPTYLYFLLWGAFFFVMMRFGCGAHIMGHGHRHSASKPDDVKSNSTPNSPRNTETKNEHRH